ncbi:unnamed protein product [Caenorhabditis brenneri]
MKLLRLPWIVQEKVIKYMELHEAFGLITVSNTSKAAVKRSFFTQRLVLTYRINNTFTLERESDYSSNSFVLEPTDQKELIFVYPHQCWKMFYGEDVPVRVIPGIPKNRSREIIVQVYFHNKLYAMDAIFQWFFEIVPRASLHLAFGRSMEHYKTNMQFSKNFETLQYVSVGNEPGNETELNKEGDNSLLEMVLNTCQHVKELNVGLNPTNFKYQGSTTFKCDEILIDNANWVTKTNLIDLFFSCKTVVLYDVEYSEEDLTYILKKWMEGCNLERLRIGGRIKRLNFPKIFKQIQGSVNVKLAKMPSDSLTATGFADRTCYQIGGNSGPKALVYIEVLPPRPFIALEADFETGEECKNMEIGEYFPVDSDSDESGGSSDEDENSDMDEDIDEEGDSDVDDNSEMEESDDDEGDAE